MQMHDPIRVFVCEDRCQNYGYSKDGSGQYPQYEDDH